MRRKTHLEFLADVAGYAYQVAGEYRGSFVRVPLVCDVCGNVWEALPSNLVAGHGCPECAVRRRELARAARRAARLRAAGDGGLFVEVSN